mmetsp:Transcript_10713/g.17986  ORF Transcript_10713/g.17986 Transcript_10713/m.17986 type:complete len:215 (+) Transcript_10713:938-1582(+)
MVRRLVMGLLLFFIISLYFSMSLGFAVGLKTQFESINYSAYCPKQYLYAKEINVQTEQERVYIRNCFCERLDILQLAYGWQTQYQSRCPDYIAKIKFYYVALPTFGLVVQATNLAMSKTVVYGSRWLKFRDVTSEAVFQLTLLYFLLIMNMTLPLVLVNLDLSDQSLIRTIQQSMFFDFAGVKNGGVVFFGGDFKDTNRLFFNQINQPFHFVLI